MSYDESEDVALFNKRIHVGDAVTWRDQWTGEKKYVRTRTPARLRRDIGIVFFVGLFGPRRIADCTRGWLTAKAETVHLCIEAY